MHRHVRKLRLTCGHEDDARHGRVLLDDALRTASLGDETRLILVRRLDLGHLSLHASATHWSRRVEDVFRHARPVAVRFDSTEAAHANAVFFANQHEPWLTLAERVATGQRCDEWFWRAAAPRWSPSQPVEETLRRCFRTLAAQGGLGLTLGLGLRLQAQGVLPALLRVLQPDDVAGLRLELGAPVEEAESSGPRPEAAASTPPIAEADFARRWGPHDLRTRWLAALVVAHNTVPDTAGSLPPAPAATILPALVQQVVLQWTDQSPPGPPAGASPPPPPPQFRLIGPDEMARPPRAAPAPDHAFTQAGGLFFIIVLLARAGFTRHLPTLAGAARAALPWQVLRLCLRHARIPATDPLVIALEGTPPPLEPIGRWVLAAHRHARASTGLTLREVIARPALVTLSPTHVDVLFRPTDADIRIRSAGLDFDPGWVPWLSRVIAFHFTRET
jgi:hypothetical protein